MTRYRVALEFLVPGSTEIVVEAKSEEEAEAEALRRVLRQTSNGLRLSVLRIDMVEKITTSEVEKNHG